MSTIILNDSFPTKNVANVKCFVVDREQAESLADFVRRVRAEKRFSLSDVRRNSGLQIANSYISRIENGEVTNVTPGKLHALAKGLQVSDDEVFAVARGILRDEAETFDSEIRVAFKGFEELSDEDKRELLSTVKMLGNEIQRRRPRRPAKGKQGKK